MKKTLLVTMDFPPMLGGVAAYWKRVCESMPAESFSVLTSVAKAEQQGFDVPVTVRRLLVAMAWPRWMKGCFAIHKQMKQSRSELVLAAQLLPVGSMAYVLHRLLGVPYAVQVYGMDIAAASVHRRKRRLARGVLLNAQSVIANSQATATLANEFVGQDLPLTIVYPVPETPKPDAHLVESLREKHNLKGKPVILTVGRLVVRKGHDRVIQALPAIRSRVPETVYVVVGDGPERQRMEAQAAASGCDVRFTGTVGREERDAWFSLCDVFVMPSRSTKEDNEGFGMVYLEAAACAKPVVAGRAGGAVEAVDDGRTGLLVDPESPKEIADAVTRLLLDGALAASFGEAGKNDIETKWRWEEMAARLKSALV